MKIRLRWSNIPIPEAHLGVLIAGIVVHMFIQWRIFNTTWIAHAAGWPVVIIGLALAAWAVIAVSETNIAEPTRLITSGPYAFSRNPMYLAWTLLNMGTALVVNTVWPLLFLPGALLYTHILIIPREESKLARNFGDEYEQYKKKVRRYI